MSKRQQSPDLIPNPFIKKRNLTWRLQDTHSGKVSPKQDTDAQQGNAPRPPAAAIEAGQVHITNHLEHFTTLLSSHIRQPSSTSLPTEPMLSVPDYSSLYSSNAGTSKGAHFVIHQHDHPVAGTHYDLRLQINETSSASWAIMYGLPGDPNSRRLNRNATETRVHCLWNHLVETASASTGSLLIWDTGTYTILPRTSKHAPSHDPSSPTSPPSSSPSSPSSPSSRPQPTQQALLHAAFQSRKVRLRLHGSKLPDPYVLNLRLTKPEDAQGRLRSSRVPKFRRRRGHQAAKQEPVETSSSSSFSDSDEDTVSVTPKVGGEALERRQEDKEGGVQEPHVTSATERELRELEDADVRANNAYPGAHNSIGSVHQRRWYLSLDRTASRFVRSRGHKGASTRWKRVEGEDRDQEQAEGEKVSRGRLRWPFHVRGADYERSVVTGRTGGDVLRDEGVTGFIPRKGWKAVLD